MGTGQAFFPMSRNFQHDLTYHSRSAFPPSDAWLEKYRRYLERENLRLSGGDVAGHYLQRLSIYYGAYQQTGNDVYRFKSWQAVHLACGWLSQIQREGRS
jgi:hypothetical protein